MTDPASAWDAVVLAGGAATRMGGGDKTALVVRDRPLLEHAVAAASGARRIIAVGPPRATTAPVVWCQEDPPHGGPGAALGAALAYVQAPVVVLLAGDHPFIDADVVSSLVEELRHGDADGVVGVGQGGAPQWLCSAWRADALRGLDLCEGASLRRTVGALRWKRMPLPETAELDCDTPDDLRRARELAE